MALVFKTEEEDWSERKILELVALACVVGLVDEERMIEK
jgi:hypothetical protein